MTCRSRALHSAHRLGRSDARKAVMLSRRFDRAGAFRIPFRRVVLNVLISNVDDHLRNHGFLWRGKSGCSLSPAYDINPAPARPRSPGWPAPSNTMI